MTCKKKKFRTILDALIALSEAVNDRKKGNYQREEKRYYYCETCNVYHLTSKTDRINNDKTDAHK